MATLGQLKQRDKAEWEHRQRTKRIQSLTSGKNVGRKVIRDEDWSTLGDDLGFLRDLGFFAIAAEIKGISYVVFQKVKS